MSWEDWLKPKVSIFFIASLAYIVIVTMNKGILPVLDKEMPGWTFYIAVGIAGYMYHLLHRELQVQYARPPEVKIIREQVPSVVSKTQENLEQRRVPDNVPFSFDNFPELRGENPK